MKSSKKVSQKKSYSFNLPNASHSKEQKRVHNKAELQPKPKPERPVPVFDLPKYDLFRAPAQLFDWNNAGIVFKKGLNGLSDGEKRATYNKFLRLNYEIEHFFIDSGVVYFIFKLKEQQ